MRHGQTDWNLDQRWQGHADPPLNELGRKQARAVAESLAGRPFEALYSSDLLRARETAEIIGRRLGLQVELESALREVDVGEWSGLTHAEIAERFPDGTRRRREGLTGWERGEAIEAMSDRVVGALRGIAASHPGGLVAVVTHGGPMRAVWLAGGGTLADRPATTNCDVDEIAVEDGGIRRIHSARGGGLHEQVQG